MTRLFLFVLLLPLPCLLPAQIVDAIKSASDANLEATSYSSDDSGVDIEELFWDSQTFVESTVQFVPSPSFPDNFGDPGRMAPFPAPMAPEAIVDDLQGADYDFRAALSLEQQYFEGLRSRPSYAFVEATGNYAFHPRYRVLLGQVRAGYGPLSTAIRYNQLVENGSNFRASYTTIDWQILRARFLSTLPVQAYVGVGLMYETYNDVYFSEYSAGMDLNFLGGKLYFPFEYRVAVDPDTKIMARQEASGAAHYRFWDGQHFALSGSVGYVWQRYYEEVTLRSPSLGLRVLFF